MSRFVDRHFVKLIAVMALSGFLLASYCNAQPQEGDVTEHDGITIMGVGEPSQSTFIVGNGEMLRPGEDVLMSGIVVDTEDILNWPLDVYHPDNQIEFEAEWNGEIPLKGIFYEDGEKDVPVICKAVEKEEPLKIKWIPFDFCIPLKVEKPMESPFKAEDWEDHESITFWNSASLTIGDATYTNACPEPNFKIQMGVREDGMVVWVVVK